MHAKLTHETCFYKSSIKCRKPQFRMRFSAFYNAENRNFKYKLPSIFKTEKIISFLSTKYPHFVYKRIIQ